MSPPPRRTSRPGTGIGASEVLAAVVVLIGAVSLAFHLTSLLQSASLAHTLMSDGLWQAVVRALGGRIHATEIVIGAEIELGPLLVACLAFAIITWLAWAWLIARRRKLPWRDALSQWGIAGWRWWFIPLLWEAVDLVAAGLGALNVQAVLESTPAFWLTLAGAGWMTTGMSLARRDPAAAGRISNAALPRNDFRIPRIIGVAAAAYVLCYGTLNWLLYAALQVPHGDSAMYEEHLWNLLHGKGFRSYLDRGDLFLAEHVQVVHLLLIPLYLLWPSHVMLEWCQSLALAAGAVPVYWIATRHTGSPRAAALLASAYLFYFPMQFLDIAIDFKTFRPNSFEIPFFLFALDAMERSKLRCMMIWLVLALSAQEDAAAIIAPLGVWMAATSWRKPSASPQLNSPLPLDKGRDGGGDVVTASNDVCHRTLRRAGVGLAAFGAAYVLLVVKVVLPWFRGGADVHFAQYFTKFGNSSNEIASRLLTQPWMVIGELVTPESALFVLALLLPLGFLPLLAPGRLAVALPLFGVLCLSPITNSPRHHFHAPLIPILFWAAAAGMERAKTLRNWWRRTNPFRSRRNALPAKDAASRRIRPEHLTSSGKSLPVSDAARSATPAPQPAGEPSAAGAMALACWALACAVLSNFFFGLGPASLAFWDPYSRGHWQTLYVPGERARQVRAVVEQIPQTSRVASTDFVHPRFTHYERSYDYSHYRPIVPDDTEYIVIDTQHPYSDIKRPEQVKELREHPDRWELLPDRTSGYFIVLKRRTE